MLNKKEQRLRRARTTRNRIAKQRVARLTVFRSNLHIYASVISDDGERVLASASTSEADMRKELGTPGKGGNAKAAEIIGRRIASPFFLRARLPVPVIVHCAARAARARWLIELFDVLVPFGLWRGLRRGLFLHVFLGHGPLFFPGFGRDRSAVPLLLA